ncbi:MAG TPA: hypothetical protein VFM18_18965 [Methanosarcina sp.]|nr:hypothetical protein [Methanosarcina sp.]
MNTTSHLPESICPTCKYIMDAATSVGEKATPSPGDISLCMGCGELLEFNDDLILVKASESVLQDMPIEQRIGIAQLQGYIRQIREHVKPEQATIH